MNRWPRVDPERRRTLLARMRARRNRQSGELTPAARVRRAAELAELAAPGIPVGTDEPPELLLRMIARFREVG